QVVWRVEKHTDVAASFGREEDQRLNGVLVRLQGSVAVLIRLGRQSVPEPVVAAEVGGGQRTHFPATRRRLGSRDRANAQKTHSQQAFHRLNLGWSSRHAIGRPASPGQT